MKLFVKNDEANILYEWVANQFGCDNYYCYVNKRIVEIDSMLE